MRPVLLKSTFPGSAAGQVQKPITGTSSVGRENSTAASMTPRAPNHLQPLKPSNTSLLGVKRPLATPFKSPVAATSASTSTSTTAPVKTPSQSTPLSTAVAPASNTNVARSAALHALGIDAAAHAAKTSSAPTGGESYYEVMYCVRSNKKHKTYQDGYLEVGGQKCVLKTSENKQVSSRTMGTSGLNLSEDDELLVGNYELVIGKSIPTEHYRSGRVFTAVSLPTDGADGDTTSSASKPAAGGGSLLSRPGVHSATAATTTSATNSAAISKPTSTAFKQPALTNASSAISRPFVAPTLLSSRPASSLSSSSLSSSSSSATSTSTSSSSSSSPTSLPPHPAFIAASAEGAFVLNPDFATRPFAGGHASSSSSSSSSSLLGATAAASGQGRHAHAVPTTEVPVVVESFLSRLLRPHQREGVLFLYSCVMGLRIPRFNGCILADEMGLGKTLQAITLVYTLLRTGPTGRPACRKVVIVCPSTLTKNWAKEFKKWLGTHRIGVIHMAGEATSTSTSSDAEAVVSTFVNSTIQHVIIISYEMFRKHSAALGKLPHSVMICDEGHRLKNAAGNQTINALSNSLATKRILLTGTPVQNDLTEFFAMVDFVNPGVLGSAACFRASFNVPITRSRDVGCTAKEKELGQLRAAELGRLTSSFILRRTNALLAQYLPPKEEYIVFCKMSPLQQQVYTAVLRSKALTSLLNASTSSSSSSASGSMSMAAGLRCLTVLKKLTNHPSLLYRQATSSAADDDFLSSSSSSSSFSSSSSSSSSSTKKQQPSASSTPWAMADSSSSSTSTSTASSDAFYAGFADAFPSSYSASPVAVHESGKLAFVAQLLEHIHEGNIAHSRGPSSSSSTSTSSSNDDAGGGGHSLLEKVVIVSNYQETLSVLESVCKDRGWKYLRLDGSTSQQNRSILVDRFQSPHYDDWIFLLSTQAGGVGLNLTAANRLVLFDPNWNPAHDLQAMGRVWRDGQTRPCSIYRLLGAGSIDEKIFQRQTRKGDVAASVMNEEGSATELKMTDKELRALFQYAPTTTCDTFRIIEKAFVTSHSSTSSSSTSSSAAAGSSSMTDKSQSRRSTLPGLQLRVSDPSKTVMSKEASFSQACARNYAFYSSIASSLSSSSASSSTTASSAATQAKSSDGAASKPTLMGAHDVHVESTEAIKDTVLRSLASAKRGDESVVSFVFRKLPRQATASPQESKGDDDAAKDGDDEDDELDAALVDAEEEDAPQNESEDLQSGTLSPAAGDGDGVQDTDEFDDVFDTLAKRSRNV